jgi:hypothetical protein
MMIPDTVTVSVAPLPGAIRAFARKMPSGRVCIVVNEQLDKEAQEKALEHELKHVQRDDFESEAPVDDIEDSI